MLERDLLSTLEPDSAYSAFNLNLASELAAPYSAASELRLNRRAVLAAGALPVLLAEAGAGGGANNDPSLKAPPGFKF